MKSNAEKCHLLVNTSVSINIRTGSINKCNRKCEKLLGAKLGHKFIFYDHISELCENASRKIHPLVRVAPYINVSKRFILMNAFFTSQFCPLIWMCFSRTKNRKINVSHKLFIRKNSRPLNSY